jgi:polyhydroxybutyrate depolymerase
VCTWWGRAVGIVLLLCIFLASETDSGASAATVRTPQVARSIPSAGCRTSPVSRAQSDQDRTLTTATVDGSYLLWTPGHRRGSRPAPLVLLFYGFASNPSQFAALTALPRRGAESGDVVVVPHTQPGETEWQFDAHGTDAAFVDALVSSVERSFCINTAAVFATGFSAGAAFTLLYACAREAQIAAIATVAVEFQLGCATPMSILAFHGTKDPLVPYQNGAIGASLPGTKVEGTQRNMTDWAHLDTCHGRAERVKIGGQVVRQVWRSCVDRSQVILYTIVGGGHTWPGANPKEGLGLTTQQVNATTEILTFFRHH